MSGVEELTASDLSQRVADAFADSTRPKAYVLCSPHNPTGTVHTRQELGGVAALARQRQELQSDLDVDRTYGDAVRSLARMVGTLDRSRRVSAARSGGLQ